MSFAPGAFDGIWGGGRADEEESDKLYETLAEAVQQGFGPSWATLYEMLTERSTLDYADEIIERIVERRDISASGLYALARFLVERAPDREPVKFGIALLGIFRHLDDREIFMTLGRHDEFTLYCAVALSRTQSDPDIALWELAQTVQGWGRVQVVERLADTENELIKDWLLREGFKNTVMYQYIACTCAATGGLLEALDCSDPDDELLDAACELIAALAAGGPADDMDDYKDGPEATDKLLHHLTSRASKLQHFCAVAQIRLFLQADEKTKPRPQEELGWTKELCRSLESRCDEILYRSWWPEQVRAALEANATIDELDEGAEQQFLLAARAAKVLRLPTFRHHWRRLRKEPMVGTRWYLAIDNMGPTDVDKMISFAERRLSLDKIATGPAEVLGLGQQYRDHTYLDLILQKLIDYPGKGWELVSTALKSPVVRNRVQAIKVLSKWHDHKPFWRDYVRRALEKAAREEPDKELRARMDLLLEE